MKHPFFNVPRIRSVLPLATASLLLSSWVPTASARLFLDPAGSTDLMFADSDESIQTYPLSLINYFGTGYHGLSSISINGNLYYGDAPTSDSAVAPLGFSGSHQISPFWQDLTLGANGSISVFGPASYDYLAVTWQNMEMANTPGAAGKTGSFQALIFENATTLNNIDFLAGDIVFSYDNIEFYADIYEFVVGLQTADGASISDPSYPNGWYSPVMGSFPYTDDEYLLFRASGSSYLFSVESMAIPEPSTVMALLSGSLLLGFRSFQRRQR